MAGLIQVLVNYEVAAMLHALAIIRILLILRNMFKWVVYYFAVKLF
jgi:hypothetical protein